MYISTPFEKVYNDGIVSSEAVLPKNYLFGHSENYYLYY